MEKKCLDCKMPRWIKKQNSSIKDNTGLCSMCYLAKEHWEKQVDEDFDKELRSDAEQEDANEMLKEMEG